MRKISRSGKVLRGGNPKVVISKLCAQVSFLCLTRSGPNYSAIKDGIIQCINVAGPGNGRKKFRTWRSDYPAPPHARNVKVLDQKSGQLQTPGHPSGMFDSGIPPKSDLESAIVATLNPAGYTAIVSGKNGTSGVALVEVYDLDQNGNSKNLVFYPRTPSLLSTGREQERRFAMLNGHHHVNIMSTEAERPRVDRTENAGNMAENILRGPNREAATPAQLVERLLKEAR